MKGRYVITILPKGAVVKDEDATRKNIGDTFKIKGDTFPNVPLKFFIRPRAANFANSFSCFSRVWVVLHMNEEHIECICMFRFRPIHESRKEEQSIEMCRCVGSMYMKRHWYKIFTHISNNMEEIKNMKLPSDALTIFEK